MDTPSTFPLRQDLDPLEKPGQLLYLFLFAFAEVPSQTHSGGEHQESESVLYFLPAPQQEARVAAVLPLFIGQR